MFTMNPKNVISQFPGSLPIVLETETEAEAGRGCCLNLLKSASDELDETFYVVDFKSERFLFVAGTGFFLCGLSSEEVMRMVYEFINNVLL